MSPLDPTHLRLLEAILFASADLIPLKVLTTRLPDGADLPALLAELKSHYSERGINLVQAGQGWGFRTAPDLAGMLNMEVEVSRKLSRAGVETLSIIAYHQPVTRGEIEEIRGVSLSKGTLDVLFEAGWVKPRGRRRTPGRPMTWGTTDPFLDHFGLENLSDLPGLSELKAAGLLDTSPGLGQYSDRGGLGPRAADDPDHDPQDDVQSSDLTEAEDELFEPMNAAPDDRANQSETGS